MLNDLTDLCCDPATACGLAGLRLIIAPRLIEVKYNIF